MSEIRLQKYLSQEGILSRRKAEEAIVKGLIFVNGKRVTTLGTKVDPFNDKVTLDKQIAQEKRAYHYVAFNKPKGICSNCPDKGEKEIRDLLPEKYKQLHTIGRLDKDSEGLILLTDDGVFANKYLNSEETHEKKYLVWLNQPITEDDCIQLSEGVDLGDSITKPCTIKYISERHIIVTLTEGKNRQIRRMFKTIDRVVVGLKRVQFGTYFLGDLPVGQYRAISSENKPSKRFDRRRK